MNLIPFTTKRFWNWEVWPHFLMLMISIEIMLNVEFDSVRNWLSTDTTDFSF